ncbi:hypothetical protein [Microbispora sp. H10836]|nr:hypothetical protein [Microbispora sp. H10836]
MARLVSYVSQTVEPLPGDLAPTGGPAPHPVMGAASSPVNPLAMK